MMEECCPSGVTRVCYRVFPVRSRLTWGYTGQNNYPPFLGFQSAEVYEINAIITGYEIDIDASGMGIVTISHDGNTDEEPNNPMVYQYRRLNTMNYRVQEDNVRVSLGRKNDYTISRKWQVLDIDTPADDFTFSIEVIDYYASLAQKITATIQIIALLPALLELQPFLFRLQTTLAQARIALERIKGFTKYQRCVVIDDSGETQGVAIRLRQYGVQYNDSTARYFWQYLGGFFSQPIKTVYFPYGAGIWRVKCCPAEGCGDETCEDCPDGTSVACDSGGYRCCYDHRGKCIKRIKL